MTRPFCESNRQLFRLTFRESDGIAAGASISAQLLGMRKSDGARLGVVPNAAFPPSSAREITPVSLITHFDTLLDFAANDDDVRVDIDRPAGSTHAASFNGVGIECR